MTDHTTRFVPVRQVAVPGCRVAIGGAEAILFLSGRVRIGTAPGNELRPDSDTVSRHHCVLERRPDGWMLRDLDSTNGTRVGGARVAAAILDAPCTFKAGEVPIRFEPAAELFEADETEGDHLGDMVGSSKTMRALFSLIRRVAPTDVTVLLEGETGTGKEVAARRLHELSDRRAGPFVVVDCAALPRELVESELFGHERGAFTGALEGRMGLAELAEDGTLFLDEIGELPLDVQPRLLRLLERREIRRVGGRHTRPIDVRVIAATNRDLRRDVDGGRFRKDLLFRLDVVRLVVPPLRDRIEDLEPLVERFCARLADAGWKGRRGPFAGFDAGAWERLRTWAWNGNVRELYNVVQRAAALAEGALASSDVLPFGEAGGEDDPEPGGYSAARRRATDQFEREFVRELLRRNGGNLSRASREAHMDRKHLRGLVLRHGLAAEGTEHEAGDVG
ncbi:MAG: sigma 54-interacting transcriptional regulator [Pseudomonadota bacterium]